MVLPNVVQGDPHVQAHNDERSKINEIDAKTSGYASLGYPIFRPSGLGWDEINCSFSGSITDLAGSPRSVAAIDIRPRTLFDVVSNARIAPGASFFVDYVAGSDTNPGTSVSPFKSVWKAVLSANSAGVPTLITVIANPGSGLGGGSYPRSNNFWYNGGAGVTPTVDIAFVAKGGRVNVGTHDDSNVAVRDTTYTNCFKITVANCNRVLDIANLNRFGNYNELNKIGTTTPAIAICNTTPDSWCIVAGVLYINRADQQNVSNQNTRFYRPGTSNLSIRQPVNIYLGGLTDVDGFDLEGGSLLGVLDYQPSPSTPGTIRKVIAAENCTFKYGGGYTENLAKGVAIDSLTGISSFSNCRADANWTDGFNFHNNYSALGMFALTVNCSASDNGRPGSTSNNGWTTHENIVGIDIAGYYEGNRGGTVRSINATKSLLIGTTVKDDWGDLYANGQISPTAFQVDNTAEFWCDRTKVIMAASGNAYVAFTNTSKIHKRDVYSSLCASGGAGLIDTY